MKTKFVKVDPANPDDSAINDAAKLIDSGLLAAFPTETVYGIASRVQNSSLKQLSTIKGRTADKYYTLHIAEPAALDKYVPKLDLRAVKLIKNTWPGPLTIVFELDDDCLEQLKADLAHEVFENLYKDKSIGVRCPDNIVSQRLISRLQNPIVAPSANIGGDEPAITAEQVLEKLDGKIDMILNGGPTKYGKSSTVVKIGKNGLAILREGAYERSKIEHFYTVQVLFVCTGNTCRSPMAEGIFKKRFAEKLGCKVDRLSQIGYKVVSAGTIGSAGWPASAEAVAVCSENGIDIRPHHSSAVSEQLIKNSDFIYVMGQCHREQVLRICESAAQKCHLLAENAEVPDPIGQDRKIYQECFAQIDRAITKRISEFEL